MFNPMLQSLNNSRIMQAAAPVRNLMQTIRSAGNPQMLLNQMAASNPSVRQCMDIVNQYGGDPKAAFYALAQQKGIDPEQILSQLR